MYERILSLGAPRPSYSSAQRSSSAAVGSGALSTDAANGKHAAAQRSTEMLPLSEHTKMGPDAHAPALAKTRLSPNLTLAASSKPSDEAQLHMMPSTESAPAPASVAPAPAEENVCTWHQVCWQETDANGVDRTVCTTRWASPREPRGWRFWSCRSQRWWIITVVIILASPILFAYVIYSLLMLAGCGTWCFFAMKYWDDWVHPSMRANPRKAQFMNSEQGLPVRSPYPR